MHTPHAKMAMITSVFIVVFQITLALCTEDNTISSLKADMVNFNNKIELLEERHHTDIETLTALTKDFNLKVDNLQKQVDQLTQTNVVLLKENEKLRGQNIKPNPNRHMRFDKNERTKNSEESSLTLKNVTQGYRSVRVVQEGYNIAFSAYLDHAEDVTGVKTLVFNQILLNTGNAYNKYSGVFTAPIAGVYSFSFFIGQRGSSSGALAALWVNNANKIDAAVDTYHDNQDLQGGNVVNLELAKNDVVFIKSLYSTQNHIESSNSRRFSSFSGFLLFPIDDSLNVGK